MAIQYDVTEHQARILSDIAALATMCGSNLTTITPTNVEQWRTTIKANLSGRHQTEALIILRRISYAQHAISAYLGGQ